MPRWRSLIAVLLPLGLHALAREVDAAVGVLLHATLDLPGIVGIALGLVDPARLVQRTAAFGLTGAAIWLGMAWFRARQERTVLRTALAEEADLFSPLYLRPALTLLALLALSFRPVFPYGFTLPVALTQDWSIAQDLATAAAVLASRLPSVRLPAPRTAGVFFMAFLGYGLLTPERARYFDGHPGNEPKYLRMGLCLGWSMTLDVSRAVDLPEGVPPMESIAPAPFQPSAAAAVQGLARQAGRMVVALTRGPAALAASAIQAKRLARQTVAGKEGGVYHVLAPGPSFLLAPTMRLDRALNRASGRPGRMAVSVLAWNGLAAALIALLFRSILDVTGRRGLSALLAGFLALTPPFSFYFYQFYPEMPGALLVGFGLRRLLFGAPLRGRGLAGFSLLLAALPWLHQKFLPVWALLALAAAVKAVNDLVSLKGLLVLLLPQAATGFLFALWNFAITGSARPDALFLAWGPRGVTSARIGEGALGLLLDARYGLLPYAPFYLLAAAGVAIAVGARKDATARAARRWLWGLPVVLAYYLTVAAADNWSGSICNLGRYVMPVVPFLAVLAAGAIASVTARRGALTVVLALAAWTALLALGLWNDPNAANDSDLLLGEAVFADGHVYIPDLFFRSLLYGAPGHTARLAAWILLAVVLAWWLRRAAAGRSGASAGRALLGLAAVLLLAGWVLERWPSGYQGARFANRVEPAPGVSVFVSGPIKVLREGEVQAAPGLITLLVRSRQPQRALLATAAGTGVIQAGGGPPVVIRESGTPFEISLDPVVDLEGRRGAKQSLSRQRIEIRSGQSVMLRFALAGVSSR